MTGIPLEVLSMAGSTVLGGVMKLMGQAQADKAEAHKMMLEKHVQAQASVDSARSYNNPNSAWIRRFIVIMLLGFVGFILISPIFGFPTNVPEVVEEGWSFLFFEFVDTKTQWTTLDGIVTPDWLKFAMLDIIAFYFGTSSVARRQ